MGKHKSFLKRTLMVGSVGVLTAYIGSQLNSAVNRYKLKENELESSNYLFRKLKSEQNIYHKTQLHYDFDIIEKKANLKIGTCRLYMAQEADSFYGGHIRIEVDNLTEPQRREISNMMIMVAKTHLMSHLYFVGEKKDPLLPFYESLGAKFNKEIIIPEDSPYYVKKHNKIEQYKLELIDPKTQQQIDTYGQKNEA